MDRQRAALHLHALPSAVRLADDTLDDVAERIASRREAQAFERGRLEGTREAATGAVTALEQALERLDETRERAETELPARAVEVAVAVARRLLRVEIDAQRYDLERIVRETLAQSGVERGSCVVHLNPRDLEQLEGVPFRAGTRLEADPAVDRGDVHVTTAQGLFVHESQSLLAAIEARLREELA